MVKYLALVVLVAACLIGCSQGAANDEASKGAGSTVPGETADKTGSGAGADTKAATL